MKRAIAKAIKNLQNCNEVDEVIACVQDALDGVRVRFDDSRAWALYSHKCPDPAEKRIAYKYGVYRNYLGGCVRGAMHTNLEGQYAVLFTEGLKRIEAIYNMDTEGMESWEQNTGVL